jgi:hypothetical protein
MINRVFTQPRLNYFKDAKVTSQDCLTLDIPINKSLKLTQVYPDSPFRAPRVLGEAEQQLLKAVLDKARHNLSENKHTLRQRKQTTVA